MPLYLAHIDACRRGKSACADYEAWEQGPFVEKNNRLGRACNTTQRNYQHARNDRQSIQEHLEELQAAEPQDEQAIAQTQAQLEAARAHEEEMLQLYGEALTENSDFVNSNEYLDGKEREEEIWDAMKATNDEIERTRQAMDAAARKYGIVIFIRGDEY